MDWNAIILATITFLGGVSGQEIVSRLLGRKEGFAARVKSELDRLTRERNAAFAARDREATKRRQLEESLSEHRRLIIESSPAGAARLPPWPE